MNNIGVVSISLLANGFYDWIVYGLWFFVLDIVDLSLVSGVWSILISIDEFWGWGL